MSLIGISINILKIDPRIAIRIHSVILIIAIFIELMLGKNVTKKNKKFIIHPARIVGLTLFIMSLINVVLLLAAHFIGLTHDFVIMIYLAIGTILLIDFKK